MLGYRLAFLLVGFVTQTQAQAPSQRQPASMQCSHTMKPTAFSNVRVEKAAFFSTPRLSAKKKSYLVTHDFVQTLAVNGDFVCVLYRNFSGYGGKTSVGWVLANDLQTSREILERRDLVASWTLVKCGNESCTIDITDVSEASEQNSKLEVHLSSFLHGHPSESWEAGEVIESPGHLELTKLKGGEHPPKTIDLKFVNVREPGTIEVQGSDTFKGVYRR